MSTTGEKCFTSIDPRTGKLIYNNPQGTWGGYANEATERVRSHSIHILSKSSISDSQRKQIDDNLALFRMIIFHPSWDEQPDSIQVIRDMRTYYEELDSKPGLRKDPSLVNITSVLIKMRDDIRLYGNASWHQPKYSKMTKAFHL